MIERRWLEWRRRMPEEGGVWRGGVPLPTGGGGSAPSPDKNAIFSLKIAIFGAFWAAIFTV